MIPPDPTWMFGYDFYYLWSAGHLAASGANPYDIEVLRPQLQALGWPTTEGVQRLTHLPYSFWLYSLFTLLPFTFARILWIASLTVGYLFVARWLAKIYLEQNSELSARSLQNTTLLALLFPAIWYDVGYGQVNLLVLVGLIGALRLIRLHRDVLAGLLLSLTLIKPHLLIPIYCALGVFCLKQHRVSLIASACLGLVAQAVVSSLVAPNIFAQYLQQFSTVMTEASEISGASLGQILSGLVGIRPVLLAAGIAIGVAWGWRMKAIAPSLLEHLVPISLLVAPYLWVHSMVLLIPSFLSALSVPLRCYHRSVTMLLCCVTAAAIGAMFRADFAPYFAPLPLILLLASILTYRRKQRSRAPELSTTSR